MNTRKAALYVFILLLIASAVQMIHYYPRLPETIASHFSASGQADGWSSKAEFTWVYAGLIGFLAILFLGLAFGFPRLPVSIINILNRDYWLSPERRAASCAYLSRWTLWLGNATLALVLSLVHLTLRVSLNNSQHLGKAAWLILVAYAVCTMASGMLLARRFRKMP